MIIVIILCAHMQACIHCNPIMFSVFSRDQTMESISRKLTLSQILGEMASISLTYR